jgi:hypothetical protein
MSTSSLDRIHRRTLRETGKNVAKNRAAFAPRLNIIGAIARLGKRLMKFPAIPNMT